MSEHRQLKALTREDAITAFAGADVRLITEALVRVTFQDPDGEWVQDQCLGFLAHPESEVRGLAATCLGHLARIHGDIDRDRVRPALEALRDDPEIGGRAQDALDDLEMFLDGR